MTGSWRVLDADRRPSPRRLARDPPQRQGGRPVQGPRARADDRLAHPLDQRIAGLGPDILAPEFDYERFLRRLREDDPTRPIGDAVLEQKTVAGIGNLWKAEACWAAQIDPWRRTGDVSDEEAVAIVDAARPRMQESARGGHRPARPAGLQPRRPPLPPLRHARSRQRGQWEDNRTTFWCPGCQR